MLKELLHHSNNLRHNLVLILILMEHAQRVDVKKNPKTGKLCVLILILMEHAQRVCRWWHVTWDIACLNPYFNGTCSKRLPRNG